MAESGNPIIDLTTITDLQTRLAAIESALGKTNATSVTEAATGTDTSGFSFTAVPLGGTATTVGLGNIKMYAETLNAKNVAGTWELLKTCNPGFTGATTIFAHATVHRKAGAGVLASTIVVDANNVQVYAKNESGTADANFTVDVLLIGYFA